MTTQRQNNQGSRQSQESRLREESDPKATDDFPTDGSEAQRLREQRQKQEKAEGERRDEQGFSKDDESQWG